jgi:[ribosomal protein S5]-alanine N-acetyltransferase
VTARVEVLTTPRLTLRHLSLEDAAFMLELLNEKPFLENIGDRGVRNIQDAKAYLAKGAIASYQDFGFGLYAVERKDSAELIGICGLSKRESLDHPDLGFALLQKFCGQGYAQESAEAVMHYARKTLNLRRIEAITKPQNRDSIRLLQKLGFKFEKTIRMPNEKDRTSLFASEP